MNREIIYDGKLGFGHREIVYPYEGSQFIDGHIIIDNGTEKPQRSKLDIIGATIVDDPLTDKTKVTIPSSLPPLYGVISPIGTITPDFIGQTYTDTVVPNLYYSTGLTNADWVISGGSTTSNAEHRARYLISQTMLKY